MKKLREVIDAPFLTKVRMAIFRMPKLANNTLNTDREGNQARLYRPRIVDSRARSGRAPCVSGVP